MLYVAQRSGMAMDLVTHLLKRPHQVCANESVAPVTSIRLFIRQRLNSPLIEVFRAVKIVIIGMISDQ